MEGGELAEKAIQTWLDKGNKAASIVLIAKVIWAIVEYISNTKLIWNGH